jgi:hypothetical protein
MNTSCATDFLTLTPSVRSEADQSSPKQNGRVSTSQEDGSLDRENHFEFVLTPHCPVPRRSGIISGAGGVAARFVFAKATYQDEETGAPSRRTPPSPSATLGSAAMRKSRNFAGALRHRPHRRVGRPDPGSFAVRRKSIPATASCRSFTLLRDGRKLQDDPV